MPEVAKTVKEKAPEVANSIHKMSNGKKAVIVAILVLAIAVGGIFISNENSPSPSRPSSSSSSNKTSSNSGSSSSSSNKTNSVDSNNDFYDNDYVYSDNTPTREFVCAHCGGTKKIDCTNPKCRNGSIYVDGTSYDGVYRPPKTYDCPSCSGGKKLCPYC